MRSAPSGEEWRSQQYTVPVSPQCPQEIGLLTLPRTVFQGAVISSELSSQFLRPGNVVELGCSPPLLEQLVRLSPAGVPFQGTQLAALITPEASLKRLVPLVDCLAVWKLLPNVSQWVVHTVERLQNPVWFSSASIQRYESHSGGSRAGSGNGTRSRNSLEKGGHRGGPSSRKRVRVLQPVLHSSQKGWRVSSHFRSASVEPLSQQTEVKDAHSQAGHVSDQVQGLVCHDQSKGRILPYLHPSLSQRVPEVCFWGRSLPISGSSLRPSTLTPHRVAAGFFNLKLKTLKPFLRPAQIKLIPYERGRAMPMVIY